MWAFQIGCSAVFSNLIKAHDYELHNFPSPKEQPELAGPVQTINGLELGIRYAQFCPSLDSDKRVYQAAFISPYHDMEQWAFKGQHYLDWVPLDSFLVNSKFDVVGNETERKALVDGMRQLGLGDDGVLDMETGGSTNAACQQEGSCSSELPEPYICRVDPPVYPTPTGCGRTGGSPCPGRCLDQEEYQKACDERRCVSCCHVDAGANETVVLSQVWYAKTSIQTSTLLV